MIRTIQIQGFKSILSQTLELGRVNCFIGANGAGKTALLEAIGLLGAAANGSLDDAALKHRGVRPGVPELYRSSFKGQAACPRIRLCAEHESGACYRVSLESVASETNSDWVYSAETLDMTGGSSISRADVQGRLEPRNGFVKSQMVRLPWGDSPERPFLEQLQDYAIYSPNTLTTHNPAVIDGLNLTDDEIRLFAVDRNSAGHTLCERIVPTPELLALNQEYPLSRLWLMGNLGAVPNV